MSSISDDLKHAQSLLVNLLDNNSRGQLIGQHTDDINHTMEMLADDNSRDYFRREIQFLYLLGLGSQVASDLTSRMKMAEFNAIMNNLSQHPEQYQLPTITAPQKDAFVLFYSLATNMVINQYEYQDKVKVREGDIFLDCGACLGDTALWAYSKGAKTVYSFEPSPANYKYLQLNFKQNHIAEDLAILSAVGKEKGTLPFLLENQQLHAGACRCISEERAQEIEGSTNADLKKALTRVDCIKLDDFCKERNVTPTFIKMDIEGAELDALQGAAATIKQHKPRLAICLYHNVAHMWEIPAYVKSLVPEYKLYCKKNHPMWEFVLYATVD